MARSKKSAAPQSVRTLLETSDKHYEAGDAIGALRVLGQILGREPSHLKALSRVVRILAETGEYAGADPLARRLVALAPDDHEVLCLAGFIAACLGDSERAGEHYHKALTLRKTDDLCNRIGRLLIDIDQPDKALPYFQEAAALGPDRVLYIENLVLVYRRLGRFADAFRTAARAILRFPDETRLKALLTSVARGVGATEYNPDLKPVLTLCLKDEAIEHQNLVHLWSQAVLSELVSGKADPTRDDLPALTEHEMLRLGLRCLLPAHPVLERFLTRVRTLVLKEIEQENPFSGKGLLPFLCALSEQCFFNEYVFFVTEEEQQALSTLRVRVQEKAQTPDAPADPYFQNIVSILGCYEPLYKLQSLSACLGAAAARSDLPAPFRTLLTVQIKEPMEEADIAQGIGTAGLADDDVSRRVRAQYEENPYPRWRSLYREPSLNHATSRKPLALLIAGCGTGRQILIEKSLYPNAKITAIDLSLASLAYARRKCNEAGLKDVTCLQSDILLLDRMDETFDVVFSSGVIHHMAEPEKALRSLTNRLKPGGVLNLGLYSRRARQAIAAFRETLKHEAGPVTADRIRARRQDILSRAESGDAGSAFILRLKDFYALSSCRDLLFHAHEICYSLPEIGAMLDRAGLAFLGFSFLEPHVLQNFQRLFPEKKAVLDLAQWDTFEVGQPDAFASMYQFFVCRRDEESLVRKNTPFRTAV
jgi:ubiquinone/menaquinone biosynthesis C-methylase UbiE/Flp pilus assembly protein TadD